MSSWLHEFRDTVERAAERLVKISEEDAGRAPSDDKWSSKEIIGHLIDSAANNHQRFVRAQFTDDLVGPPYEQENWVKTQRYKDEPWVQLVQLWRLYNLHICHLISAMPVETRTKLRARHNLDRIAWKAVSSAEPVTLEYFMQDYVAHLRHHLDQIFAAPSLIGEH